MQQACGTGLQAINYIANKIATGQIEVGIGGGVDTTSDAPIGIGEGLRQFMLNINRAKDGKQRLAALAKFRPSMMGLEIPANGEPRTGLSMGEHQAITTAEWAVTREAQDELAYLSHKNMAAAYERGFFKDLMTPYMGLERDDNLRPGSTIEKLATLKPVFGDRENGTMTAGNSTPLTDGASAVLLASKSGQRQKVYLCWRISPLLKQPLLILCIKKKVCC